MIEPYYQDDACAIYHGDCREILPQLEPVDLVLTDPPYGTNTRVNNDRFKPTRGDWWSGINDRSKLQSRVPVYGDDKPFNPEFLLDFPQLILWGANNFASKLPDSPGWFVWDKRRKIEGSSWPLSSAELAWTNTCKGIHVFRHRWFGLLRENQNEPHLHPTQKPVTLMEWCIRRVKNAQVILDPFMGSGTTLRAAKDLGRKAIGIEIEEKYCEIAVERLRQEALPFA